MHIFREKRQAIVVELGVMEAKAIARLLSQTYLDENLILAQLRNRLEYHVKEATEGNPNV